MIKIMILQDEDIMFLGFFGFKMIVRGPLVTDGPIVIIM